MGKNGIVITVRAISKSGITHLNKCSDYTYIIISGKIFLTNKCTREEFLL